MRTLMRRIQKLESRVQQRRCIQVRFGKLRRLPEDYKGQRHAEFAGWLPKQGEQEWVVYRELPGPDPVPPRVQGFRECIDVIFVTPYAIHRGI